jgi:hypothetical protein
MSETQDQAKGDVDVRPKINSKGTRNIDQDTSEPDLKGVLEALLDM